MERVNAIRALPVVVAMFASATSIGAQGNANAAALARSLEGVWRFVEDRSPDQTLISNQPGFRMFVDGHYSVMRVAGLEPRVQPNSTATAEEVRAVFETGFIAQAGTYEVIDDRTIVERVLISKAPRTMAPGNFFTMTARVTGDSLWVNYLSNQAGPIANAAVAKYVRIR